MFRVRKQTLLVMVVGMAAFLATSGAMAQRNDDRKAEDARRVRAAKQDGKTPGYSGQRQRVLINGKEDQELSRRAVKVGSSVMVPSDRLFQSVGGEVKQQRGWSRPGSQHPEADRNQDWYVVQRGGRELRYRPNERLYYYGGTPHYFTNAPYERDGSIYLALGDIALIFGGKYDYDANYYDGRVTLGEYDYRPAPRELRLTYPYSGQHFGNNTVVVEGYATPYTYVQVDVRQDQSFLFLFTNSRDYSSTVRADRRGLFSTRIQVPGDGRCRVTVESRDEYGRGVNRQTVECYVR